MAKVKDSVIEKTQAQTEAEKEEKPEKINWFGSVGRRKRSIARVRIWLEKNGKITVNNQPIENYFKGEASKTVYEAPLASTNRLGQFAISVKVTGGGSNGQLEATALGIANALVVYDETLREALAKKKLLTRDPREKERRKYGYAGKARARKQSPKR